MGTAVTISPFGIPVHEAPNGMPVEISTNGSGMLVRYTSNGGKGLASTPVQTKGGYPGATPHPDGTLPASAPKPGVSPITSVRITAMPYSYSRNFAVDGKAFLADTFGPTWSNDDNVYSGYNDGNNLRPGTNASANMGALQLGDSSLNLTLSLKSTMPGLGSNNQKSTDGSNYKSGNMISVDGVLYIFACRQGGVYSGGVVGAQDAQLIKSTDKGATWAPYPPSVAVQYTSPTLPGKFASPWFIQYGKDGVDPGVHNAGTYVYAVACSAWNNGSNLLLGRVLRSAIGNLNGADWTFYQGGDGMVGGSWGALATAVPIISNPKKLGTNGIQWIPSLRRYIMFQWYYPGTVANSDLSGPDYTVWDVYESATPWGPWTKIQSMNMQMCAFYSPSPNPKTLAADGSMTLVTAGDYTDYGTESNSYYQFNQITIKAYNDVPPLADPVFAKAPVIRGSSTIGSTITCNAAADGEVLGFMYQWYGDGRRLTGEKGQTYTLKARDQGGQLWCVATPFTANGTAATALSSNVMVLAANPNAYAPVSGATYDTFTTIKNADITVSNSGRTLTTGTSSTTLKSARANLGATTTGKFYFEATADNSNTVAFGVGSSSPAYATTDTYLGGDAQSVMLYPNFLVYNNVTIDTSLGISPGDIVGIAFDAAAKKVWFSVNGIWLGDPSAGTGGVTVTMTSFYPAYSSNKGNAGNSVTFNFGANGFRYTNPTGFTALTA